VFSQNRPDLQSASSDPALATINAENVVRLSASTFHNIGNVVTVAKLSLESLRELCSEEAIAFMLDEIMPVLQREADAGNLDRFVREDEKGREYFQALSELLTHQREIVAKQVELAAALDAKLRHIGEIIDLQQRLTRNIGTRQLGSLQAIVEDGLRMIAESAQRHNVDISKEYGNIPPVHVDVSMITQVIINLLKNAIEALDRLPQGNRHITITTELDEDPAFVSCCITDTGPGIDGATRDKVFEFGFTTKEHGQSNGVGLYYCRTTIEKHGGTIRMDSDPGQGTSVLIRLPTAADDG
jgi:signal transduction histidine kinase